jgi:hypothetical protein
MVALRQLGSGTVAESAVLFEPGLLPAGFRCNVENLREVAFGGNVVSLSFLQGSTGVSPR